MCVYKSNVVLLFSAKILIAYSVAKKRCHNISLYSITAKYCGKWEKISTHCVIAQQTYTGKFEDGLNRNFSGIKKCGYFPQCANLENIQLRRRMHT